ncbi:MAG: GTPase HflX [bacterium]
MKDKLYKVTLPNKRERAILVGVVLPGMSKHQETESLQELAALADTAGAEVVDTFIQDRKKINIATLIGKGMVNLLSRVVVEKNIQTVIFDVDLSPVQMRNLENKINRKIIDRSGIILDIFSFRARSHEAKVQVELAQLEYYLPRLTRLWAHLTRQEAAIGTRGPGETQLESDRRLIRKRIAVLKKELKKVEIQRRNRRRRRKKVNKVALVGYTNVGKSSLMNSMADEHIFVENRLFATLDPTIRSVKVNNQEKVLLIDTVGFIRKLPHHLIAAFRSTLGEAGEAEVLLHVVDISHPQYDEQMATVNQILKDLNIIDKPTIIVFNKIDKLEDRRIFSELKSNFNRVVFTSALKNIGINKLKEEIADIFKQEQIEKEIVVPADQTKIISQIHEGATVLNKQYENSNVVIRVRATKPELNRILSLIEVNNKDDTDNKG